MMTVPVGRAVAVYGTAGRTVSCEAVLEAFTAGWSPSLGHTYKKETAA